MTREEPRQAKARSRPVRILWVALGFLALALGFVGIFLPVLPTTPFVILAAFAFGYGSPALLARLENHKTFGPIILEWRSTGAIAPRYKIMACSMMVATLLGSIWLGLATFVLAIQGVCMAGAAAFVLSRPNGNL